MKKSANFAFVWEKCMLLCREYIDKGTAIQKNMGEMLYDFQQGKEEFAINSRYLHRGFYCPSPTLNYIVTNMRRGKIAKRLTKVSKVTNRYVFDTENKLRIAETFYPDGSTKTEYIFHDDDIIFGLTFDMYKHISEISVEHYADEKIESYFWACCYYSPANCCHLVSHMQYESYCYDIIGFLDMELYDMLGNRNDLGKYNKYRFNLDENGNVIADSIQLLE